MNTMKGLEEVEAVAKQSSLPVRFDLGHGVSTQLEQTYAGSAKIQ